jgi:hypothetical protein
MTDKLWKQHERAVAALLGGTRVPITGRQRGDVPDVAHDSLSIECKHRESIPKWITTAMEQAEASIKDPGQVPIAVIHTKGQRRENDLVVMRLKHFKALSWWDNE